MKTALHAPVAPKRLPQDAELNLAPIIDCFTVLILYLLLSASFLAVSSLDVGVALVRHTATLTSAQEPSTLELHLLEGGQLTLTMHGRATAPADLLHPLDGTGALPRRLGALLSAVPSLGEVTVGAAPSVSYGDVVRTVELAKKYVPKVYIAAGGW